MLFIFNILLFMFSNNAISLTDIYVAKQKFKVFLLFILIREICIVFYIFIDGIQIDNFPNEKWFF